MPETDGDIPFTGDERVQAALQRVCGKFRDLEDALIVQAHLEKRQSERIKEHAEAIDRHEAWMAHFESKLEALTDILMRREGGPEAH